MSSAFSQTLNSITTTKLELLSKQHADFTSYKTEILYSVKNAHDPREKVRLLLDGIKSWRGTDTSGPSSVNSHSEYLRNVERFLFQAQQDPSINESCLSEWEDNLTQSLETEKVKFEYAELFGRLLTEWIASSAPPAKVTPENKKSLHKREASGEEVDIESLDSPMDAFEKIGRKEMHEQRLLFEAHVFVDKKTNTAAITAYLEDLFSQSKESKNELTAMRKRMSDFGENLLRTTFTVNDLESTIRSLLATDLLSNEKRNTLKEFVLNKSILTEVTDVLNMHLSSLPSWSWTVDGVAGGIPVEMRRHLNGKYRIFMDEEILQAIFLHYIGSMWGVEFKRNFFLIYRSRAWKLPSKPLSKAENERRGYFLSEMVVDDRRAPGTIDGTRRSKQSEFFMSQLPNSLDSQFLYDSDCDSDSDSDRGNQKSPVEIKQSLLHILTTECLLNTTWHNKFTVVRSDFSWFGPSLSHTSIIAALSFFGVGDTWLTFFQKFLSAPLKFVADGPSATIQVRKCGVPVSHSLSDLFGEVLLFCMDYAVNQRADGLFLYRIHDDFWFWNSDPTVCVKAWREMNKFTRLVGIEFNYEKTGSVSVGQSLHPDLPRGTIKWGFLKFEESGQFVIDQAQVDIHIAELKLQLAACDNSIFAWVQAYNKYVSSFFVNNFGSPPAQCFGSRHVDMVVSTLQRIQLELFPKHQGSVTAYLADVIQERFSVRDIPTGWYYWPTPMGGLEVKNPFIPLYALRDSMCVDPLKDFQKELENEEEIYTHLKENWDNGTTKKPYTDDQELRKAPFMSYEEYKMHREQRLMNWTACYVKLLAEPTNCTVALTAEIQAEMNKVSDGVGALTGSGGISMGGWSSMSVYWQWIVACFGEGMVRKWGGLEVVRPGSLPVGMIDAWKSKRLRWEQ